MTGPGFRIPSGQTDGRERQGKKAHPHRSRGGVSGGDEEAPGSLCPASPVNLGLDLSSSAASDYCGTPDGWLLVREGGEQGSPSAPPFSRPDTAADAEDRVSAVKSRRSWAHKHLPSRSGCRGRPGTTRWRDSAVHAAGSDPRQVHFLPVMRNAGTNRKMGREPLQVRGILSRFSPGEVPSLAVFPSPEEPSPGRSGRTAPSRGSRPGSSGYGRSPGGRSRISLDPR